MDLSTIAYAINTQINRLGDASDRGFWPLAAPPNRPPITAHLVLNPARRPTPIAEKVKASVEIPGLFTVYQDTTNGSTKMLITTDQIGQEFIYWGHSVDGPVAAGHNRGSFRDNKVFSISATFRPRSSLW